MTPAVRRAAQGSLDILAGSDAICTLYMALEALSQEDYRHHCRLTLALAERPHLLVAVEALVQADQQGAA